MRTTRGFRTVMSVLAVVAIVAAGTAIAPRAASATDQCGFVPTNDVAKKIRDRDIALVPPHGGFSPPCAGPYTIPVVAHIITSGANPVVSEADVTQAVADANIAFAASGIVFDPPIFQYHESADHYNIETNQERVNIREWNNVPGCLNMYFVNTNVDACGSAWPMHETTWGIFIKNSCTDDGATVTHELGHYFWLFHTFDDWPNEGIELVARPGNCEWAGDLLCDTPAEPGKLWGSFHGGHNPVNNWDNCTYVGPSLDDDGDPYAPDPTQYMSYSPSWCKTNFSPESHQRMQWALFTYHDELMLPAAPALTLDSPVGGECFPIGATIQIQWSDGDPADLLQSVVELSRDGGSTWELIHSEDASGFNQWNWSVSGTLSNDCVMRVRNTYTNGVYQCPSQEDVSGVFEILNGVDVTGPPSGSRLVIFTDVDITWTSDLPSNCYDHWDIVAYYLAGGGHFETIASGLNKNDRSFTWNVEPNPLYGTGGYTELIVAARDASGNPVADDLDGYFVSYYDLSWVVPQAGASYDTYTGMAISLDGAPGYPITYTYKISRNGGSSFTTLATTNTPTLAWNVQPPTSNNCIMRVEANDGYGDFQTLDSGVFSITPGTPPGGTCRNCPPPAMPVGAKLTGETRLLGNYPNPFNPITTIWYEISEPTRAAIAIYDVSGRRVRAVDLGEVAIGFGNWTWDGRSDQGDAVSSGVYFIMVQAGNVIDRKKAVLLK